MHLRNQPEERRVADKADHLADGTIELASAPIAGGASIKLNGTLPAGGTAGLARFSHDGGLVVYAADEIPHGVTKLFFTPSTSSAPVRISGTLVTHGHIRLLEINPEGSRVVYLADQDTDEVKELCSVPLGGSSSEVKLNAPLTVGRTVLGLVVRPDGSDTVYLADPHVDEVWELRSAFVTTGVRVKASGNMVAGDGILEYHLDDPKYSPDGRHVVYLADQDTDGVLELYATMVTLHVGTHLPLLLRDA